MWGRERNKSRSNSENEKKSIKVRSGTQKEIENVETSWQEAKANVCSVCLFIAKDRRDPHGSAVQPSLWGFLLSPSFYHPFGLPFAMLPFAQCRAWLTICPSFTTLPFFKFGFFPPFHNRATVATFLLCSFYLSPSTSNETRKIWQEFPSHPGTIPKNGTTQGLKETTDKNDNMNLPQTCWTLTVIHPPISLLLTVTAGLSFASPRRARKHTHVSNINTFHTKKSKGWLKISKDHIQQVIRVSDIC